MNGIDPDVVSRAVDGDGTAVARLLAQIRPLILRYCLARFGHTGGGRAWAEDVTQEVCLAVLRALPSYAEQGRPFIAFVYRVASRKVTDAYRAARRDRIDSVAEVPDMPDPAPGPEGRALVADAVARLDLLLAQLPSAHREILILRLALGMTAEQVGTALDMSAGAVRLAQHRALTRLRALAGDTLIGAMP